MNNTITIPLLPGWPMDLDGTKAAIERMESEAQTHENPFADHPDGAPPLALSRENETVGNLAANDGGMPAGEDA